MASYNFRIGIKFAVPSLRERHVCILVSHNVQCKNALERGK